MLFASLIAAILLPVTGASIAYGQPADDISEKVVDSYGLSESEKQELLEKINSSVPVDVKPTINQQKIIDEIEKIQAAKANAKSDEERQSLQKDLDSLRPSMIKAGIAFSEEFHEDPKYWAEVISENAPVKPINKDQSEIKPTSTVETGTLYFVDSPITPVSSNDWYLVHRLYYSCSGGLVCNQGLWEYADDNDWSSVTATISLSSGNYIRLEHEASNLHTYSVTRDFDSYWTHVRGTTILDTDTKFTTQYFTALEREIQDGLLETWSAQTGDTLYSTIRMTP